MCEHTNFSRALQGGYFVDNVQPNIIVAFDALQMHWPRQFPHIISRDRKTIKVCTLEELTCGNCPTRSCVTSRAQHTAFSINGLRKFLQINALMKRRIKAATRLYWIPNDALWEFIILRSYFFLIANAFSKRGL